MLEKLAKYNLIIFDYSDTLFDTVKDCPIISKEVILILKENNKKLAVFTASSSPELQPQIQRYYSGLFDIIITNDDVKNSKPDPEGIIKILKELKFERKESIFIGDSINDLSAANSARIKFVKVEDFLDNINL